MTHGGTKYHVTALAAAVFGLLCLPCLLAPLLISAGLSSILLLAGTWFTPLLIGLIGLSLIGFFLSYRGHKNWLPLVLAAVAGVAVYRSHYVSSSQTLTYLAVVALLGAIGFDWWMRRHAAPCGGCAAPDKATKTNGILT